MAADPMPDNGFALPEKLLGGDAESLRPPTIVERLRSMFLRFFHDGEQAYLLALAVVVGLLMGLVAVAFRQLITASHHLFFAAHHGESDYFDPDPTRLALRALMPAFGGLIVGFLIYKVLKLTGGHGVPSVMRAIATGNAKLPPTMAVKSGSSVITITSGGSCGPEGPIVEIGSVVGSLVGQCAQVSRERLSTLIGCGAASGVAAFFNAPFGGVFLAIELLLRDFQMRTFGPVMIAAIVAHITSEAILPHAPLFAAVPDALMATIHPSLAQLMMFAILGGLCGAMGSLLVYTIYRAHDFFHSMRVPIWVKPAIGGLGVGVIGMFFPTVIGEGYDFVNLGILDRFRAPGAEQLQWWVVAIFMGMALLKVLATSLTLGSGGTGGAFAPAMVTGAMVGGSVGVVFNALMPTFSPSVPIFAMVGMAGTVCSALGVPLAGILIIYEIAGGDYRLVLPLMICVVCSSLVSAAFRQGSVYTLSLLRDGFDVEEALERSKDPLRHLTVATLMRTEFTRLPSQTRLGELMDLFASGTEDAYVVVDAEGNMVGVISADDLRGLLNMGDLGGAIIAADAADPHPDVVYPDSSAADALALFSKSEASAIAVLERSGSRRVVGLLGRTDLLHAWGRRQAPEKIP